MIQGINKSLVTSMAAEYAKNLYESKEYLRSQTIPETLSAACILIGIKVKFSHWTFHRSKGIDSMTFYGLMNDEELIINVKI